MKRISVTLLLRAASVVTLLYCAGHSSGYPWTPATGSAEEALIRSMQSIRFEVEGATRTYWDFYVGFGLTISAFLLASAVAFWHLAGLAKSAPTRVMPLTATLTIAFLLNTLLGGKFFFALPTMLALAIAALLGASLVVGRGETGA